MPASEDQLLDHIALHAGDQPEAVRSATHAVLSVIGAYLAPAIRELVAAELCPPLGAIVVRANANVALPIEEHVLVKGMTVARAEELIASVLTVLADELSDDALAHLHRALPAELGDRLVRPAEALRDRPVREQFHASSIATANPHGDSKLSSGHERTRETLAEGRPGSSRPLAGK